jgi:hypothetical protein
MCKFKSFTASALCSAALVLSSCGTTGSTRYMTAGATTMVSPNIVAENLQPTAHVTGTTQITVGNLTDPCTLTIDDPWWTGHGGGVEFHRRCG